MAFKKLSKEALKKSIDDVAKKLLKTCVFACFPAGTLIQTQHGTKPIEDIQIGDLVWAYDEDTNTTALQPVVDIMQNETDHTISLYTETEVIETTATHPFYTQDGWKDASELQTGDQIKTQNQENIEIKDTKFNYEPQKVYNFTVGNFHTYFVGVLAWLVHNAGKCLSKLPKQIHHFATNKSKKWTKAMEDIAKKFGLKLDAPWNKEALEHLGRHPDKYHEWVLKNMEAAAKKSKNADEFVDIFEKTVKSKVRAKPELLRKIGWK